MHLSLSKKSTVTNIQQLDYKPAEFSATSEWSTRRSFRTFTKPDNGDGNATKQKN